MKSDSKELGWALEKTVDEMLVDITPENRAQAMQLWRDLETHIPDATGSSKNHQAWEGGYRDHIREVMNLAYILYERLSQERKLPFALPSALLVLFLHDCEKPFRRASDEQLRHFPWVAQRPGKSDAVFQKQLVNQYGFQLSKDEWNGLDYVEGEKDEYTEHERVQGPLAAFCHVCDVISARIWFDHPRIKD